MQVRLATDADEAGVRRVAIATGQGSAESGADRRYVRHIGDRGTMLVATDETGEVVAFGGSVEIGEAEMLTDLFVDPAHQGRGVGRALLDALWPPGENGDRFTFSSRHPLAVPLYIRAGLVPFWPLLYLRGPKPPGSPGDVTARRTPPSEAAEAEAGLIGIERRADYEYWTEGVSLGGVVVHVRRRLVAAGAVAREAVVHLVCADRDHAAAAVMAAAAAVEGTSVGLCLPGPHPAVGPLVTLGYVVEDYDIFMATAADLVPVTTALSPSLA